jgi:hypothetical protein
MNEMTGSLTISFDAVSKILVGALSPESRASDFRSLGIEFRE